MSQETLNNDENDIVHNIDQNSPVISSPRTASINLNSNNFISSSHSNSLRSISLVDSVEFQFEGNISKHALALGDCDNDEKNELVIGTLNGELLIYKNNNLNPQASTKDLGMIACILVGDILNLGWNCIISLSIEGYLKIFHLYNDYQTELINQNESNYNVRKPVKLTNSLPTSNMKLPPTISDNEIYSSTTKLILVHCQQMQANAMCAMLVDFDNDGQNEFLVALSDRVVRCYRSVQYGDEIKLIGLYKWEFSDQIGCITLHNSYVNTSNNFDDGDSHLKIYGKKNKKSILVTQFGGVFAKISCYENDNMKSDEIERTVEYCHIIVPYMRNPQASSEILSNIVGGNPNENLIAIATHDGTVILLNNHQTIKWRLQLEHPILSLNKLDLNNDGRDELIVSIWSGLVYIIDLDGNIITCHFHEPISAFTVGHFHLNDNLVNCFIYTTFTNSAHLYYNIDPQLFNIDIRGNYLIKNIKNNRKISESLETLMKRLNINSMESEDIKNKIIPELIRTLLYEIPK